MKRIEKAIAKEVKGYSTSDGVVEDENYDELCDLMSGASLNVQVVSILLCDRLDKYLQTSKDAIDIDHDIAIDFAADHLQIDKAKNKRRRKKKLEGKVRSSDVNEFNRKLVEAQQSEEDEILQLTRHNRLHQMMADKALRSNNSLYHHLGFFTKFGRKC